MKNRMMKTPSEEALPDGKFEPIAPPFWSPALMEAFILDWDGVLANTNLDFQAVRDKYFGGEIVPLIERAAELPPPLDKEAMEAIVKVEMDGAARAEPVEGAFELLSWLAENGKKWCVVSRNCRESIELAASRCGITLPEIVMSREDEFAKPDPRALVLSAGKLGVAADRCVMVGDFIYDMLGARRVPMRCALVEFARHAGRGAARWRSLADASWPKLKDFAASLPLKPAPLVPWEYRELAGRRGESYLRDVAKKTWRVGGKWPLRQAFALARQGALNIIVPKGAKLELEEWEGTDLPSSFIDLPLHEALNVIFAARWPEARAFEDGVGAAVSVPEDLDEGGAEDFMSSVSGC